MPCAFQDLGGFVLAEPPELGKRGEWRQPGLRQGRQGRARWICNTFGRLKGSGNDAPLAAFLGIAIASASLFQNLKKKVLTLIALAIDMEHGAKTQGRRLALGSELLYKPRHN